MVKIINILERIKDYDCVINPPIKRNTNPETLKKVQDYLSKYDKKEWNDLNLIECLESLHGRSKLFQFEEKKDHNGDPIYWECKTYINEDYLVTAKAPTKIEVYRLAVMKILKKFYYFPFDKRLELPIGLIGENKINGTSFEKKFTYPPLKEIIFNEKKKFDFKEEAHHYFSKKSSVLSRSICEPILKQMLNATRIDEFRFEKEIMIKIHQFIWIGSDILTIFLDALQSVIDIEVKKDDTATTLAKRIKESFQAKPLTGEQKTAVDMSQNCCSSIIQRVFCIRKCS